MTLGAVTPSVIGLLPVVTFLAVLLYFDSYKLVRLRMVLGVVACGAVIAVVSYEINAAVISMLGFDTMTFSRYVAPVIEELLKAAVVVALIRTHRIGFPVDAAICGFAVGTGFAVVENVYFLHAIPDAGIATWIVRGFGTAFMHGGVTAIFAITGLVLRERARRPGMVDMLPGFALAVVLHMGYNHLSNWPRVSAVVSILLLAPLLHAVFRYGETALGDWLGQGFDADAEMLELIDSGSFSDSRVGRYLLELRDKFEGPVVADLLCYLRIYTELALKAKGVLIMREAGFDATIDESTREKFAELRYLEKSIGKTGRLAIQPMLHMSHKELWQLYMIGA